MNKKYNYDQRMDIKFDHHDVIDVPGMVEECTKKWFNQTLPKVNDSVLSASLNAIYPKSRYPAGHGTGPNESAGGTTVNPGPPVPAGPAEGPASASRT